VNNTDVANVKAYNDAVAKLDPKKPVALLIKDEQGTRYITLRADTD
jgi:serine protease Do